MIQGSYFLMESNKRNDILAFTQEECLNHNVIILGIVIIKKMYMFLHFTYQKGEITYVVSGIYLKCLTRP